MHEVSGYSLVRKVVSTHTDYAFGSYDLKYTFPDKNAMAKASTFTLNAGLYPRKQFATYKKMRNDAYNASKAKVVLVKE